MIKIQKRWKGGVILKYKSLKVLFHMDERTADEVYNKRFESEATNKLGVLINNYECFYMANDEIINLLGRIYSINMWFDKIVVQGRLPGSSQNYILLASLIEEIRSSNRIEGIYSTRKEIQDLLTEDESKRYRRFYGMVNKYNKLLKNDFPVVSSSLEIRELYNEVLLKDVIEEEKKDEPDGVIFRKGPVSIASQTKVYHRGVDGEANIIDMMDKSLRILNNEKINEIIRVAVFHYLFEYIHPFYNGNGRMGRFLVSGYLSRYLNLLSAFQFSIACLHNKKKYYQAFEITNDVRNKSDLTVFIISFLEIYLNGLEKLKFKLESTIEIYTQTKYLIYKNIDSVYHSFLHILLESTLFAPIDLNMKLLTEITSLTEQSIRRKIKAINKKYDCIIIHKEHKPYQYSLDMEKIRGIR